MSTHNTTGSRRIVFNTRSEMTIRLVDAAGTILDTAYVDEDGSCELSEEALASADGVVIEPAGVLIDADAFREQIETEEYVDVTELLAGGVRCAGSRPGPPPGGIKDHTGG